MANRQNKPNFQNSFFLSLAFEQAKDNIGSTKSNPSVGCVVEKNGAIVSSGRTSFNGRPHAEYNALNKNRNFKNSNIYITLEPCSHYGFTPPCTNIIIKKKIKNVYYSSHDCDLRSSKKSKKILKKNKISVKSGILKNYGLNFYKSYYLQHSNNLPLIDGKIAISKDYFTKNKKSKWITNIYSRKRSHLIRSMYNCIISTSKSINDDNSLLTCRINGLEKKSPDLIILDRYLKLNKKLKLLNNVKNRKIFLFTSSTNRNKIFYFKKKGIKVIKLQFLKNSKDFKKLFLILKKMKYSRILIESGLTFMNFLIKNKFMNNLYIFKTLQKLKQNGINYSRSNLIKKIKLNNKINVNLYGDELYKERLK